MSLAYDPLVRLWQVWSTAGITQFVYDGDALVLEYDGSGNLLDRYVHGSNAAADDPLVWFSGSGLLSPRWLHSDHLGSIVAMTDSSGASPAIGSYDEYGIPASTNSGRFQYTGQAWIPEIGMYYYKARIYSPRLGRFMQTDPVGYKDQVNLYAYVGDDPVDAADPTGSQEAILYGDYEVSRSATYSSNDPNAGIKAAANMNVTAVSGALAVGGIPGSIAEGGLAASARTAAIGAAAGAAGNAGVAVVTGQPVVPAVRNGALGGVLTALAPGGAKARLASAAAVANAAAASTRATGGSTTEAAVSGAVAGAVEFVSGSKATAAGAGQATASVMRSFAHALGTETLTTAITNKLENLIK